LIDLYKTHSLDLRQVRATVFDEADRMLDMGFYPQIKKVLMKLPRERQTAMFSATFSPEIRKLAREIMKKNPVEVQVGGEGSAPVTIDQQVREVPQGNKNDILMDELNARNGSVLIFTKTKHKSDKLTKFLLSYGYKVNRIHGNRTQAQRKKTIDDFKAGSINILVATDIAARGLDIAQVGHVINYDLPQVAEDYIHRIGRTGRNGSTGQALTILIPEDRPQWKEITKLLQKTGSKLPTPIDEPVGIARPERKTENFHQPRPAFQKRPSHHFGGKPAHPGRSRDNRDRDSRDPIGPNGGQPKKHHRKGPSQGRAPAPGGGGNRPAGFAKKRDPFKQRFQPRIQSTEPVNAY
jgi:ATP-dependent RNA helicase RhlE